LLVEDFHGMEPFAEQGQRRFVSIPNLTAWLSLCILAAAWGRSLDDQWQPIWADMGAYGLAASVGLGVLERARLAHKKRARQRAMLARAEFGLAKLNEQGAALDAINAALKKLRNAAGRCDRRNAAPGASARGRSASDLRQLAMEITPVIDHDEDRCELAQPLAGALREISARGLSFTHERPFLGRVAVLTFRLAADERLSFVVDVLSTAASPEGFVTSASVLDVGVPAEGAAVSGLTVAEPCPA
jgi:hypothetical protein